jgi:hypothetical protein
MKTLDRPRDLEAGPTGQREIRDDEVHRPSPEERHGLTHVRGGIDPVALAGERWRARVGGDGWR